MSGASVQAGHKTDAAGVVFAAFGGELQGPLAAAGYDELAGLLQNEWE